MIFVQKQVLGGLAVASQSHRAGTRTPLKGQGALTHDISLTLPLFVVVAVGVLLACELMRYSISSALERHQMLHWILRSISSVCDERTAFSCLHASSLLAQCHDLLLLDPEAQRSVMAAIYPLLLDTLAIPNVLREPLFRTLIAGPPIRTLPGDVDPEQTGTRMFALSADAVAFDVSRYCERFLANDATVDHAAPLLPTLLSTALAYQADFCESLAVPLLLQAGYSFPTSLIEALGLKPDGRRVEPRDKALASPAQCRLAAQCLWQASAIHTVVISQCMRHGVQNQPQHRALLASRVAMSFCVNALYEATAATSAAAVSIRLPPLPLPTLDTFEFCLGAFNVTQCGDAPLDGLLEMARLLLHLVRNHSMDSIASIQASSTFQAGLHSNAINSSSTSTSTSSSSSSMASTAGALQSSASISVVEYISTSTSISALLMDWVCKVNDRIASLRAMHPTRASQPTSSSSASPDEMASNAEAATQSLQLLAQLQLWLVACVTELLKHSQLGNSAAYEAIVASFAASATTDTARPSNQQHDHNVQRLFLLFEEMLDKSNDTLLSCLLLHCMVILARQYEVHKVMGELYDMVLGSTYPSSPATLVHFTTPLHPDGRAMLHSLLPSLPPIPLLDSLSHRSYWTSSPATIQPNCTPLTVLADSRCVQCRVTYLVREYRSYPLLTVLETHTGITCKAVESHSLHCT